MIKNSILWLGVVLLLSACGEQLIKPQDKHVEAMVEFEMPDYDSSIKGVTQKVEKWMLANRDIDGIKMSYLNTEPEQVKGRGVVTFNVRSEPLAVKFNVVVEVISPNLVKFDTDHYEDLVGPRQGESDRAYVFYTQVKDHVLAIAEDLEDFLNEDTRKEDILDIGE